MISTGDLLREAVRNNTPLGAKAKGFMDAGKLVPDELVIGLIKEKLAGLKGGFLLDGFPRNLEQAKMLDQIAKVDLAVNLEVDEQIIVDRIVNRRSCKQCNEVYHLEFKPTKVAGKCDKCGGELYQRTDDTEDGRPGAAPGLQGTDPAPGAVLRRPGRSWSTSTARARSTRSTSASSRRSRSSEH